MLDDLFGAFINVYPSKVTELKRDAEAQTRSANYNFLDLRERRHPYKDMLNFVSTLYEVRISNQGESYHFREDPICARSFGIILPRPSGTSFEL